MSYEILEVMCAIYSCKGLTAIRCNENMMFVIDEHLQLLLKKSRVICVTGRYTNYQRL